MRKKLEALLDKHYNNYRFSDPLYGETKDYVLDAMEEALTLYGVVKSLNLEVKPTFDEWLNTNFSKYDNEYYQDSGRNGIWKKHQLYKLYKNTTI